MNSFRNHYSLSNEEFEIQFQNARMNPSLFSHEAHLRLAWIHIKKYGVKQAVENICSQIKQFDKKYGDGTKYNVTITVAAVYAVHHFMQKTNADTFEEYIQTNGKLITHFKELINSHYSWDIFQDEMARQDYLEPDLQPF